MPDACINSNLAYSLRPPCIPPGTNWRQLPFTCFSIFTTWHSLPLATISDWGAASWCNWQSLCSPEKERVPFCHCGAEGQGRAQPVLAHSYPAGHTFPEDKAYSSSSATSAFPSEAFRKKVLCHLHQLPQPSLTVHFSCFSGMFSHVPLSMNTYLITFKVVSVIMYLVTGIRKQNSNCLKP